MNNLSIVILCTNIIKGTKSLGSMGLLKITNKKNLIDYHVNNIKLCWPDSQIIVIGKNTDTKLAKYIENETEGVEYLSYELDDLSNECESLLRTLNKNNINNNFLFIDINCILDKSIFKKFSTYDMSKSFVVHNKHISYESKLGCISDIKNQKVQNIFFDLPLKILKYYYISNTQLLDILKNKPARSKFLFENLNETNTDINIFTINTKKCININSIKDYKNAKEINFV